MKREETLIDKLLKRIGVRAKARGKDKLSDDEIAQEVEEYRREKRKGASEPVKTRN
jgi:hypothetical protein